MCAIRDFETAKQDLSLEQIEKNLRELKGNLKQNGDRYARPLRKLLKNVNASSLSWRDHVGSQVLSSESMFVKQLGEDEHASFMVRTK
jgi:hypothetical protein